MLHLVEVQKYGDSGPLLTNGDASIFYWEDKIRFLEDEQVTYVNKAGENAVLRAVSVYRFAYVGGWQVNECSVLNPREWFDGRQIFSCDSRLSSAA